MKDRQRLVLAGGGHAHVLVLRELGIRPIDGVEITLIAKEVEAPYSGMLPGYVAGHYRLEQCLIDLRRIARFAGARLIHGAVTGIDPRERHIMIEGQEPVSYDVLSIDVGITPDVGEIAGASEHALLVKPVSVFAPKWQALEARALEPGGPRHLAVVGGGAAGVELVLAARHKLRSRARALGLDREGYSFTLVAGGFVLEGQVPAARALARKALTRAGVEVIENDVAVAIGPGSILLKSGRELSIDAAIVSTRAKAAAWLRETGLPTDGNGFLALKDTLASTGDDRVFAGGDCATVLAHPRPKAGVFAVRQGPVLADNLRRRLLGEPLRSFTPQSDYLALISLGGKRAIATRGGLALAGCWAWAWKDYIDRRFMAQFEGLGA